MTVKIETHCLQLCGFQIKEMNVISRKRQETLVLSFIDEQSNELIELNKQIFVPETVKDNVNIDFTEMLQRQWNMEPEEAIYNQKVKAESEYAKRLQKTAKTFKMNAENGGLVSTRFKNKGHFLKLLNVETILESPIKQEEIDEFLQSSWFQMTIRVFVVLYIVGLALTDYSFRLETERVAMGSTSTLNKISLHFQLFSNCAFTIQVVLKMFSRKMFFENPWNVLNLVGCLACWSSIFLDIAVFDAQPFYHFLCILRILLGVRIVEMFQAIKGPFESFITTIPELGKIFFPYLIFVLMYSVLGLILFMGANESRCRLTPEPVDGEWPEESGGPFCGSGMYKCQAGYCGSPTFYGLPVNLTEKYEYNNQFGLVSYDNVAYAVLTTYHYMFMASWSAIMFKYSKFMNPYLTFFYFFTSAIFLFFIMSNLNMITICKTFIEKEKSKEKFNVSKETEHKNNEQEYLQAKMSALQFTIFQVLRYADIVLLFISSVVILIQYKGMSKQVELALLKTDFFLTLLCLSVLIAKTALLKKGILHDKFVFLDFISILISVGDFCYCGVKGVYVMNPSGQIHEFLRGIKIIRIIRILYFAKNWFTFEKTILKIFIETLNSVKSFFLLLFSVILIFAFIGQNLFANRVRFKMGTLGYTDTVDIANGRPYVSNYDNIYKAIVSVTYLLENEHWGDFMYMNYQATGWIAVFYFTIVTFIMHLLLARLFIAIFLCYFRRNLEKKNEEEEEAASIVHSAHEANAKTGNSKADVNVPEILDNRFIAHEPTDEFGKPIDDAAEEYLFWVFRKNHCFFQFLRACYNSLLFYRVMVAMIALHCLTIIARTNSDNQTKTHVLDIIQQIPLMFYILEFMLGVAGFGFYWSSKAYLKQSKLNYINVFVTVLIIVSEFQCPENQMLMRIARRFVTVKVLTLFTRINKETSVMLDSISAISESFIRMIGVYIFLLIISSLLPLKLAPDALYACQNYPFVDGQLAPNTYQHCMLVGGDWVGDTQQFNNIFQSLALMYQIVTSESWIYYIERFNQNRPWDVFFVLNFFIYNLCLLNIFVGLTVETFLSLKDKAYKLNLLRPHQRMWVLIRNCINELVPVPSMKEPQTTSRFRKVAYKIISQSIYQNFIDILPFLNVLIYVMKFSRADPGYIDKLDLINIFIIIVFMVDILLKLQLHMSFFYLDNSKVEFCGFVYFVVYGLLRLCINFSNQTKLALEFIGAFFLILRCKRLIFRFTWCKTLLNSVIEVLPKCVIIGALLALILFIFISIGMQIFKHTKPSAQNDGYTTGFNNAFTSFITLLKIVSNETWFFQVSAFTRTSTPADICFPVPSIALSKTQSSMGCGTYFAYVYFILFHMLIVLLVFNLLIATMTAAYDENYEKEYKSVNIFQLQDCLKLWQKYDPDGTGLIPYKKFWRLSSEIAILFGISKRKLIKSKQKFLEELDIEICQSTNPKHSSVLCYKFHDVLIKFSKVKLTVSKNDAFEEGSENMDFQIHPIIQREIQDYITKTPKLYEHITTYKNLKSGEMKYFFGLLRKMRAWRIVAKKKDSSSISKLSHIIKVALEKKQKEEVEITRIRNSLSNFLTPIIT